jgi:F-type H+-transporting ATPase subunit b
VQMQTLVFASLLSGFGINGIAFLSQLVSFGIAFFILWRWGFPAIIKTLDRRQAIIREGVQNAEKAKRDLEEATRRAEQVMLEARRQAQDVIANAQKAAEGERTRILEEARAQQEQIGKQEVARIQQAAASARAELSRMVVNLSINAASQVIGKSVDSKDNRRLVEEFVSSTASTNSNGAGEQ